MALMDNMKKAVSIEYDEPISKAVALLGRTGFSLVVTYKGKYQGMLDDRVLKQTGTSTNEKVGHVSVKSPVLPAGASSFDAAKLFTAGKFKALPIIGKGKKPLGIVTRADLLRMLASEGVFERARVKDVMGTPAYQVDVSDTVAQARSKMRRQKITHLVVMEGGRPVGTFTTYDVLMEVTRPKDRVPLAREKFSVDSQPVGSFFRRLDSIGMESSLQECAMQMAEGDISEMVVVSNGIPVGIIVANDVFKVLSKPPEARIEVSGLEGEDREHMMEIMEQARATLAKLGTPVDYLSLHVKRKGAHQYDVQAHAHGRHKNIGVSSHAWNLYEAVKGALGEIKKIVIKEKPNRMHGSRTAEEE
jgi:CBS domain-containing protein